MKARFGPVNLNFDAVCLIFVGTLTALGSIKYKKIFIILRELDPDWIFFLETNKRCILNKF